MRRYIMSFLFLLAVAMAPNAAFPAIKVTLSDGINTRANTTAGPTSTSGFNLTRSAPKWSTTQNGNQTLMLLGDCTATSQSGCLRARHFPSGMAAAQLGDTFKIQDIASTNRARIEKIDLPAGATNSATGADSVVLKGIKIFALAGGSGKTFTLIYETQAGDLTTISSSTGNYLATAKVKGQFRLDTTAPIDGNNGGIAATCNSGESNPCVKLVLQINALTLNGQGSSATAVVTAAVPCASNSTTSPCGTGGFWSPSLLSGDQFLANDSGSVGCGTSCAPYQKGTLTARFGAANQVLTLQNSAGGGFAGDDQDGLLDLAEALGEPGVNQWLASCSGDQPLQVQGLSPFGNQGRDQGSANANFPAKFALFAANLVPATGGFTMESVADNKESLLLSSSAAAKNNFCLMALIFSPTTRPQLKNISPFKLAWTDFVVGNELSINSLLGTLSFSPDCTACFRVEIDLLKDGVDAGFLTIYLGTNAIDDYKTGHDRGAPVSIDFFSNTDSRVDAEQIIPLGGGVAPQDCCITFASAASNGNYGKLLVRAVRVVLESTDPAPDNHQVTSVKAEVGPPNPAPNPLGGPQNYTKSSDQLLVVSDNYTPSCNWPPEDGLIMQVYKKTTTGREWVETILDPSIAQCTLKADIDVTRLDGAGEYDVEVLAFVTPDEAAAATAANQEFTGGIPLGSGLLVLK